MPPGENDKKRMPLMLTSFLYSAFLIKFNSRNQNKFDFLSYYTNLLYEEKWLKYAKHKQLTSPLVECRLYLNYSLFKIISFQLMETIINLKVQQWP